MITSTLSWLNAKSTFSVPFVLFFYSNFAHMKTENDISFGNNLARKRKLAGLTQAELAYRCDFDRTYIGAIERGEKSVTVNTLAKLANGLGVRIADLFDY